MDSQPHRPSAARAVAAAWRVAPREDSTMIPAVPWSPLPTPEEVPLTVACECGWCKSLPTDEYLARRVADGKCPSQGALAWCELPLGHDWMHYGTWGTGASAWGDPNTLKRHDPIPNPEHPDNMPERVPCPECAHTAEWCGYDGPGGPDDPHPLCSAGTIPNPAAVSSVRTELLALRVVEDCDDLPDAPALVEVLAAADRPQGRIAGQVRYWPEGAVELDAFVDITGRFMRECKACKGQGWWSHWSDSVGYRSRDCGKCQDGRIFTPPSSPWVALQRRHTYTVRVVDGKDGGHEPTADLWPCIEVCTERDVYLWPAPVDGRADVLEVTDRFPAGPPPVGSVVTIAVDEDLPEPIELDSLGGES